MSEAGIVRTKQAYDRRKSTLDFAICPHFFPAPESINVMRTSPTESNLIPSVTRVHCSVIEQTDSTFICSG